MTVYRYTAEVQKEFKLPIKPEPWLHCAVYAAGKYAQPYIAIWVWDTRQLVRDAHIGRYQGHDTIQICKNARAWLAKHATVADDNHRPLKGPAVHDINDELAMSR